MKFFAICRRASRFSRKTRSPISPNGFSPPKSSERKPSARLHHELPYAVAVFVEKFEDNPRLLRIEAVLNVERDTQKKILIGHKGAMLRKSARKRARSWKVCWTRRSFSACSSKWRRIGAKIRSVFANWTGIFRLEGLSSAQVDQEEGPAGGNVE